jgi:adenylate cyclase
VIRLRGVAIGARGLFSSMSIRYKIAGALIAVLCLAIASLGAVSFQQQKKTLEAEMRLRAQVLAQQLAGPAKTALLTHDELGVVSAIRELEKAGIAYAAVLDSKGALFACSDLRRLGLKPDALSGPAAAPGALPLFRTLESPLGPLLDAAVPITALYQDKTLRIGTVRLGLSQAALVESVARQKTALAWITSGFVLLALLISFALGRVLTRRIFVLITGMKVVAQGNLTQTIEIEAHDEIGTLGETFNEMILGLREKLHMEKYLSRSTLQLIKKLRDTERLKLGGERRRVAVLFSDIRGFTSMTETLDPEEVVSLLNIYLNLQSEVVHQRGGVVDKFVGDEVMAIFTGEDAEFRAALAAKEILNFVRSLNETRDRARRRTMWVGIGLNAGSVIMANMGSERQMDYTVIGDPINTAARLCSAADPGQAVMSRAVGDSAGERCKRRPMPPIQVKGKKDPVEIWELLDLPGAARGHMRRPVDLPGSCRVPGETAARDVRLRELSRGGCSFESPSPLAVGALVELDFSLEPMPGRLAASGVVKHVSNDGGVCRIGVEFNELPLDRQDAIVERVHFVHTTIAAASPSAADRDEQA